VSIRLTMKYIFTVNLVGHISVTDIYYEFDQN
jgi:hypothetical protein